MCGFQMRNGVSKCLIIFLMFFMVECSTPPQEPIKCNSGKTDCTVTNAYGAFPDRSVCKAQSVVYPKTEDELISAVASATKIGSKIKVATRYGHSLTKLVCPGGQDGVIISTKFLNNVLKIDKVAKTMTLEAGVTLKQLIDEAASVKMALTYTPYWFGMTIGGLLSTGSHGSTLKGKGSSVHDHVISLKIVSPGPPDKGYVIVRELKDGDEDLEAAKVSLGVLGVISQVILRLESMFKRSLTYVEKSDLDLGDEVVSFGKQSEFAEIIWYPHQHKALYRVDNRVPTNTSGDGLYDFFPFHPRNVLTLSAIRTAEESQEFFHDGIGKCESANITTYVLSSLLHFGLTNDGKKFKSYPVIGYQNRLQTFGRCIQESKGEAENEIKLLDNIWSVCPWDPRVKGEFFHQTALSIGLSSAKSFIQDVQELVKLQPLALCGLELYNGILLRYVTASTAYLGKEEAAVDIDFTYYRSKNPLTPRLYEDVIEEIEQMALFKYNALPHWGKNRNIAFDGVINKYKNKDKFLAVKKMYDPNGLFSSEWTDQVLGLKNGTTIFKEGCALEGLCICKEDVHCAPKKGYYCTPGKVYNEARVCSRKLKAHYLPVIDADDDVHDEL